MLCNSLYETLLLLSYNILISVWTLERIAKIIQVGINIPGRGKDCAKHRPMDFHEFGCDGEFDLRLDKREGK